MHLPLWILVHALSTSISLVTKQESFLFNQHKHNDRKSCRLQIQSKDATNKQCHAAVIETPRQASIRKIFIQSRMGILTRNTKVQLLFIIENLEVCKTYSLKMSKLQDHLLHQGRSHKFHCCIGHKSSSWHIPSHQRR